MLVKLMATLFTFGACLVFIKLIREFGEEIVKRFDSPVAESEPERRSRSDALSTNVLLTIIASILLMQLGLELNFFGEALYLAPDSGYWK